jgi:hypothetical protein
MNAAISNRYFRVVLSAMFAALTAIFAKRDEASPLVIFRTHANGGVPQGTVRAGRC